MVDRYDMKFMIENSVAFNPGIYRITNIYNGKMYIGSTNSLRTRYNGHNLYLEGNYHHSTHLQNSFNKRGGAGAYVFEALYVFDMFIWELPEEKIVELLLSREQFWLDWYDAANSKFGYNMCPKAGSTLGLRHNDDTKLFIGECSRKSWTTETREKRMNSINANKKWVLIYNYPDGKFIGKFKGVRLVAEYLSQETGIGIDRWNMIYSVCNQFAKNKGHLSSHGYTFRWWDEKSAEPVWIDLSESEQVKQKRKDDSRNAQKFSALKKKKFILVYDKNTGKFIKEVFGIQETCIEFNIKDGSYIINNAKGLIRYINDYIFKFKKDDNYPLLIEPITSRFRSVEVRQNLIEKNRKKGVAILVYKNDEFFKEFFNSKHVSRELGLTAKKVEIRIKNGQDYQGYTFKHKDSDYKPKKYNKIIQ